MCGRRQIIWVIGFAVNWRWLFLKLNGNKHLAHYCDHIKLSTWYLKEKKKIFNRKYLENHFILHFERVHLQFSVLFIYLFFNLFFINCFDL